MISKNGNGEIADVVPVSQFEPGETQTACGPFAVALCKFAGPPGKGPRGTAEDVDRYADAAYAHIFGGFDISQESGVVPEQMHQMILDAGLHYQDLVGITDGSAQATDIKAIKAALDQGYLVIGEIHEPSVNDLSADFQGNPYSWGGDWWHYVTYTGYTDTGLLTHDPANVVGQLNGPNTPRRQPRIYDTSSIQHRWAAIIWTDWLPRPPLGFDPTQQVINGGTYMGIPAGWKDDGTTLTAPNGIPVTHGFRDFVLNHSWDSSNLPLEPETARDPLEMSNPTLGAGSSQTFRLCILEHTSAQGTFIGWIGQEMQTSRQALAAQQAKLVDVQNAYNAVVAEKNGFITQINDLKAQLASASNVNVTLLQQQNTSLQNKINQAKAALS